MRAKKRIGKVKEFFPGLGSCLSVCAEKSKISKLAITKYECDQIWSPYPLPGETRTYDKSSMGPFKIWTERQTDWKNNQDFISFVTNKLNSLSAYQSSMLNANILKNISESINDQYCDLLVSFIKFDSWSKPMIIYIGFDISVLDPKVKKDFYENNIRPGWSDIGWQSTVPYAVTMYGSSLYHYMREYMREYVTIHTVRQPEFVNLVLSIPSNAHWLQQHVTRNGNNIEQYMTDTYFQELIINCGIYPIILPALTKARQEAEKQYKKDLIEIAKTNKTTVDALIAAKKQVILDRKEKEKEEKETKRLSTELSKLPELLLSINSLVGEAEATHKYFASDDNNRMNLNNIDSRIRRIKDMSRVLQSIRKDDK